MSPIFRSGSSLRRAASTDPAVPEPITRKSNQLSQVDLIPTGTNGTPWGILFPLFWPRVYDPRTKLKTRNQQQGLFNMASMIKEPVITLSAGPVAAYPRVLRAMSRPVQYDYDPWFQ